MTVIFNVTTCANTLFLSNNIFLLYWNNDVNDQEKPLLTQNQHTCVYTITFLLVCISKRETLVEMGEKKVCNVSLWQQRLQISILMIWSSLWFVHLATTRVQKRAATWKHASKECYFTMKRSEERLPRI